MNKIIQTVTFVEDPEVKTSSNDKEIVTFRGAVNKRFAKEGQPTADFFSYVAFGKTAEFIGRNFKKGQKATIEGVLENNNYEKDGVKHYGVKIIIDNIEFWGYKKDADASADSTPAESKSTTKKAAPKASEYDEYDEF